MLNPTVRKRYSVQVWIRRRWVTQKSFDYRPDAVKFYKEVNGEIINAEHRMKDNITGKTILGYPYM